MRDFVTDCHKAGFMPGPTANQLRLELPYDCEIRADVSAEMLTLWIFGHPTASLGDGTVNERVQTLRRRAWGFASGPDIAKLMIEIGEHLRGTQETIGKARSLIEELRLYWPEFEMMRKQRRRFGR